MSLKDDPAFRQAIELVKIGLGSGSIKLHGPLTPHHAGDLGNADAAYLTALLISLTAVMPRE
jgi:hypothetical protein